MFRKVGLVVLIVLAASFAELFLTAIMPTVITFANYIVNDPSGATYYGYTAAGRALPWILYPMPVLIGAILSIIVLRRGER